MVIYVVPEVVGFWIYFKIVPIIFSNGLEEIKDDSKVFCLSNCKDRFAINGGGEGCG